MFYNSKECASTTSRASLNVVANRRAHLKAKFPLQYYYTTTLNMALINSMTLAIEPSKFEHLRTIFHAIKQKTSSPYES